MRVRCIQYILGDGDCRRVSIVAGTSHLTTSVLLARPLTRFRAPTLGVRASRGDRETASIRTTNSRGSQAGACPIPGSISNEQPSAQTSSTVVDGRGSAYCKQVGALMKNYVPPAPIIEFLCFIRMMVLASGFCLRSGILTRLIFVLSFGPV